MYYEEKIIDGVLCYRLKPDGSWVPLSTEELLRRFSHAMADSRKLKAENERLKESLRQISKEGDGWAEMQDIAQEALKGGE